MALYRGICTHSSAISQLCLIVALLPDPTLAAPACAPPAGRAVSVQGTVEVKRSGQLQWLPLLLNDPVCSGDSVRVGRLSRAAVLLKEQQTPLRLDEQTTLTFTQIEKDKPSLLDLIKGAVHFISRTPRSFKVRTPFVNAAIEGTEFALRVDAAETAIWVFQGQVVFGNPAGSLTLASGEAALARSGKTPERQIVIRPRDAVQWTLFYPPLVDYQIAAALPAPVSKAIQDALDYHRTNDLKAGFARLDTVPSSARTAPYHTLRAALLLTVGRVNEARSEISTALSLDPNNGWAYALQSVVALVRNEREKALELAERATRLDPKSPVPRIALAYANQGVFEIERARDEVNKALELEPDDALAWALLAELELSLGYVDRAMAAARRAVDLNPNLARTQSVLGFAYLTEIKIDKAKEAFEKAIELDPVAPLPRLGLGLATVRKGRLKAGTREIETAAILDPNNSIVRSYLGKAYFDQKREELASTEFAIAKKLDPNDPTPYLYDAILKQTTNRPVEAARDLQKSIELNDNRAVFRSRLLLDQDLSVRSASLGRIYNELGFEQAALVQASKSVNTDPGNYSGHRFLADIYSGLRRHEIARVSEVLQSQLLQPINIIPIQPQLAESNLLILNGVGPATPSLSELNPLFTRDRFAAQVSGVLGNNDTLGNEVIQSGVWNRFSYSLGQVHYETDGFRANSDLEQDLYNAFAQVFLTPRASIQAEARRIETDGGDLLLRFDPDSFSEDDESKIRRTSLRLGFHYQPSPQSHLLGSLVYNDENFGSRLQADPNTRIDVDDDVDDARTAELQYLLRNPRFDLILGGGYSKQDRGVSSTTSIRNPLLPFPVIVENQIDRDSDQQNGYLYSNIKVVDNLTGTLGISYDKFDDDTLSDSSRFNPKFGLMWNVTRSTTLRAAWFKTIKRFFSSSQTIEPTQVAGFNQFFDDLDGTKTKRYGIGLDQVFSSALFGGVEFTWRDLEVPRVQITDVATNRTTAGTEDQDEKFFRAYLYWTPVERLALSAEYQFEEFEKDLSAFSSGTDPSEIKTHFVPLSASYFHPNGLFATVRTTLVDQEVEVPQPESGRQDGQDRFWLADLSLGYRLPKRWGIASIGVRNLFDESFRFQDINFQVADPLPPQFLPDRTIFAQVTLSIESLTGN